MLSAVIRIMKKQEELTMVNINVDSVLNFLDNNELARKYNVGEILKKVNIFKVKHVMVGFGDDDNITGSSSVDAIWTGNGNNSVNSGGGNDIIIGGNGKDTINAGEGNDMVYGGEGSDSIDGGAGSDIIVAGLSGDKTALGGDGNDIVISGSGNDVLAGGNGNDLLYAGSGADSLSGGAGLDMLGGGAGDDSLSGGAGVDILWGGSGADILDGGAEIDFFLWGKADGRDTIFGDAQDNVVFYNTNHDVFGLSLSGNNLVISYDNSNSLTINNWKNNSDATNLFSFASEYGQSYKVNETEGQLSWFAV